MTKRFKKIDSPLVSYLICFGAAVASVVLFSFIMALVASLTENPGGLTDILSLVALVLSGAFCGVFVAKFYKQNSIYFAALVSLSISLIMLVVCIIVNGKVSGSALMNYGCYIGISALSAALVKGNEGKRKRGGRK